MRIRNATNKTSVTPRVRKDSLKARGRKEGPARSLKSSVLDGMEVSSAKNRMKVPGRQGAKSKKGPGTWTLGRSPLVQVPGPVNLSTIYFSASVNSLSQEGGIGRSTTSSAKRQVLGFTSPWIQEK